MQDVEYTKPNGDTFKKTMLVLELAKKGELFDYIKECGKFKEPMCRYIMLKLLSALKHLHSKGYCNRDLKPENIILGSNFEVKITDFGFSTLLKGKDGDGKLYTPLGTPGYIAPEIILNKPYDGKQVDLFALFKINFIMLTSFPPFNHAMKSDLYYEKFLSNPRIYWKLISKILKNKNFFSKEFIDLTTKMLSFDPKDRLSLDEVLKHPWFKGPIATQKEAIKEFKKRYYCMKQKQK